MTRTDILQLCDVCMSVLNMCLDGGLQEYIVGDSVPPDTIPTGDQSSTTL